MFKLFIADLIPLQKYGAETGGTRLTAVTEIISHISQTCSIVTMSIHSAKGAQFTLWDTT